MALYRNYFLPRNHAMRAFALRHASALFRIAALGCLVALTAPALHAQFEYAESFENTTAVGWNFVTGEAGAGPSLTAATGVDTAGNGWLRLANNTKNEANAVWLNTAIPSSNNTIQVAFDIAMYGNASTPGDGIGFFLWDASTPFSTGAEGGSFAYAQKTIAGGNATNVNGMSNGYIGVALDVFGNFSSASEGRVGGLGTGLYKDTVGVRGPGNGLTGYDYIDSTVSTYTPYSLDFANLTTRPDQSTQYRHVRITLDSSDLLTVEIQFGENGLWATVFSQDISSLGIRPDQLRLGYSSSTGDATEYYEIRNLAVTATGTGDSSYWDNGAGTSIWDANAANSPNWNPDYTPSDRANIVFNDSYVNTDQNIQVIGTRTAGSLFFSGTYSYQLNTTATNNGLLILDTGISTKSAVIAVTNSPNGNRDNAIYVPIILHNNLTVNNYVDQTLTLGGTLSMGTNNLLNQGNGTTAITGVISGSGSVTENGTTGELILSGNNTYTGLTTVSVGTLIAANSGALGSTGSGTVVYTGGTLGLSNSGTIANEALTVYTGTGDNSQGEIRNITGTNTWSGAVTLTNATATASPVTIAADSGSTLNVTGVISGTTLSGINKTGAGTVILSAANNYNGATTISGGVLQISNDTGLGTVPTSVTPGQLTFNGGTLAVTGNTTLATNRGIFLDTMSGTIQVASGTTTTYNGVVSGSGGLSKSGNGTLLLTGVDTYTGATNINAGTLITSGGSSISNTGSVTIANVAGATLVLSSSETIGSLSGGGTTGGNVNLNGNTLTTGGNNASTSYGGVISGTGGLTKTGTGTMTLSGNNTYTGPTTVNSGGTLALGNNDVLSNSSSLILNGGTLAVSGHTDTVGTLTLSSSSTIDFASLTSQFTLTDATIPSNTSSILLIDNWSGSLAGGSGSQLFLTSTTATSSAILSQIQFEGYSVGATRLATGEVVPSVVANGYYWNNTKTAWGVANAWNDGTGTSVAGIPNATGALAVFGKISAAGTNSSTTGAKTVTLTSSEILGYAVFNSTIGTENYTINTTNGSTLIFSATGTNSAYINMTSSASNLISAPIALSSSLTISQNGTGTLTISGAIAGNNKAITVDGSGNTVISGNITTSTASLTKIGAGTLTLSGTNTYTGGDNLNGGTVAVTADANLGAAGHTLSFSSGTLAANGTFSLSGNVILNSGGGTINVTNSATVTSSGNYTGTGTLSKGGAGTLILGGNNTYTGATNLNAGTLIASSSNAIGDTSAVTIANVAGTTLVLSTSETIGSLSGGGTTGGNVNLNASPLTTGGNNASTTYGGIISGTGGLTKTGSGVFVLTNNNSTYSGLTTVSGGELVMEATGALGTGAVTVANGAMLSLNNAAGITASSSKTLTLSGTGITNQGALNNEVGNNTWQGSITLAGSSTIGINGGNLTLSGAINGNNNTLTLSGPGNAVLSGILSGTNTALIKTGTGTATLSGANTYGGTTTVSAGVLAITSNTALGSITNGTTIANSASLALSNNITVSNETLSVAGYGVDYGATHSGVIQSSGSNTITGAVAMSLEPNINVTNGTLTMSGILSGTSGMSKDGSGTLVLSGANTYNGTVSVNSGVLSVQSNGALGTTSTSVRTTVSSGATVQIGTTSSTLSIGESFTVNGAGVGGNGVLQNTGGNNSISGLISLAADSTIGAATGTTLSATGVIDGGYNLTKVGTGTLVLGATNTYTGSTNINGGTVVISSDANLGTPASVATVDQLTFNNGALQTATNVTLNSNRGVTLNSGGGTINVTSSSATVTYGGIVGGAGNLTVSGSGTVALTGTNNTYLGTTTVNGATLAIAGDGSLGTAPVTALANSIVLNGGTLSTSNSFTIDSDRGINVTGTGGTIKVNGAATTVTYGGDITGSSSITKSGTGTLALSADNVISSSTSLILNGGTFATNGKNDSLNTLTIAASTTLDMGGFDANSIFQVSNLNSTSTASNVLSITNWTGSIEGGSGSQLISTGTVASTVLATINFTGYANGAYQIASTGEIVPGVIGGARYWDSTSSTWSGNSGGGYTKWNAPDGSTAGTIPNSTGQVVVFGAVDAAGHGATLTNSGAKTVTLSGTRTVGYIFFNSTYSGENYTIDGGGQNLILRVTSSTGSAMITMSSTASNTISAAVSLSNSLLITQNGTGTLALTGAITTGDNDITVDGTGKTLISGAFGGATTLTKTGTGTLTLSATNSYTGGTAINGGTVAVTGSRNLGATGNALSFDGGTLAANGTFSLSGTVTLNAGGGTFNVTNSAIITNSGAVGGTGDLTKTGAGTLLLTATNSYTGDTYVNGGNLITSGGASISNTSSVIMGNVAGANWTLSSSETIGTLTGGGTSGGNVNLNANTLTVGGTNANFTYSGIISGTNGTLVKAGTGTMVLTSTNSYTGGTNITGGTLLLGSSNVISNSSNVSMSSGTTLAINGKTDTVGTLTLNGSSTIDMGAGVGSSISFANSSAINWGTNILTIANYDPGADNDYVYFGTTGSGLSAADIGQIRFLDPVGYAPGLYYARILSDGRIVPIVPEPATIIGGLLLALWVVWRLYRRKRIKA